MGQLNETAVQRPHLGGGELAARGVSLGGQRVVLAPVLCAEIIGGVAV
jgi:hypothetical protein